MHCTELAFIFIFFIFTATHNEYNICMWRLQYLLGTRYAQYMLWDVTTVDWLNKRKSGPCQGNTCTCTISIWFHRQWLPEIDCLLQENSGLLVKMSVYIIMPACVCNAKVWIDFSIGVSFVLYYWMQLHTNRSGIWERKQWRVKGKLVFFKWLMKTTFFEIAQIFDSSEMGCSVLYYGLLLTYVY